LTLRLTKKHLVSLMLITLFLIGLTALIHFLFVKPAETEIDNLKSNISMQEKFIEVLNGKKSEEVPSAVSSTEIQKKLPVIPLVEQLILQIQEAELVSKSKISNMSFSESDFAPPVEENLQQETPDTENTESETTETEETDVDKQQIIDPALLEGLKQVTVSLTVESPGYYELEEFLSKIEHQTRITKVDSLNFTGKQEITSITQADVDEPLTYAVTISTFYMPAYPELAVDAPTIEVPDPGNKKNPLFVNTAEEEEEE